MSVILGHKSTSWSLKSPIVERTKESFSTKDKNPTLVYIQIF